MQALHGSGISDNNFEGFEKSGFFFLNLSLLLLIGEFKKGVGVDQRNKPFNIKVKSGDKKAFCACLMTKNPPFCDASHKTTDKKPIRVEFEDDKTVRICGCSKSGTFPYCDGSHKETT